MHCQEGEGTKHDRQSVELLGKQTQLMTATHSAAKRSGAKFVVVLLGSAVAATWAEANADAVISAGYGACLGCRDSSAFQPSITGASVCGQAGKRRVMACGMC